MLFSLEGRIGREQWWVATILLMLAWLCLTFALQTVFGRDGVPLWLELPIFLAFQWPHVALGIKRFHDRGMAGSPVYVLSALNILAVAAGPKGADAVEGLLLPAGGGMPGAVQLVVLITAGMILVAFLSWMFFRLAITDGASGPNRYGPPPKGLGTAAA